MNNRFIQYGIGVVIGIIVLMVILNKKKEANKVAPGEVKLEQLKPLFNEAWANNSYWNSGKAEESVYEYSQQGKGTFLCYVKTVKEIFNNEFTVSTLDSTRTDRYEVMKQHVRYSADGVDHAYTCFSLYKDPLLLVKYTSTLQDDQGTTFKTFRNKEKMFEFDYDTYLDKEGKGSRMIPNTVLFEQQLPYLLRTLKFSDGLAFKQKVLEDQSTAGLGILKRYDAQFKVSDADTCWKVDVQLTPENSISYFFKKEYPNMLISSIGPDGSQLRLKSVINR